MGGNFCESGRPGFKLIIRRKNTLPTLQKSGTVGITGTLLLQKVFKWEHLVLSNLQKFFPTKKN